METEPTTTETSGTAQIVDELTDQNAPLKASDRCDSCGAQAYVRATLTFGELLFCLHHATLNKAALEASIVHWHDESDKLLAR